MEVTQPQDKGINAGTAHYGSEKDGSGLPTQESAQERKQSEMSIKSRSDGNHASEGGDEEDPKPVGEENPHGVKEMEAIAMTWSLAALVGAYVCIFIISFSNSMQVQVNSSLLPYVTSAFMRHSLLTTTNVMAAVIGGVSKFPISRIIDIWGRPEGFIVMMTCTIIGLILMASCKNVETYAAAVVFWRVGLNGMDYVLDVFVADTSSLRDRALFFAFTTSPFIATTFAGPKVAEEFLEHSTWRWGFGVWTIITPALCMPMLAIFFWFRAKARTEGKVTKLRSGKPMKESVLHYCKEFDLVGIILVCAAFALLILPLTLASYQENKWRSASIICMIVFGGVSLVLFVVWEKFFAPSTIIPFYMMTDRTVLGACILAGILFVASGCWSSYFISYLQVVHRLTVAEAGYMAGIYNIGSCVWAFVIGFAIRYTNHFKWLALIAAPLTLIASGLMIEFRQPGYAIGLVIMCQLLMTFSAGTLIVTEQMAVMAAAPHARVAVALAMLGVFTSVGQAVGLGIAGAIWTNVFPDQLRQRLPPAAQAQRLKIFGDIKTQMSYPWGSPARVAIIESYGEAMKWMSVAACAILVLTIPSVLLWRDYNVKNMRRTRGRVA